MARDGIQNSAAPGDAQRRIYALERWLDFRKPRLSLVLLLVPPRRGAGEVRRGAEWGSRARLDRAPETRAPLSPLMRRRCTCARSAPRNRRCCVGALCGFSTHNNSERHASAAAVLRCIAAVVRCLCLAVCWLIAGVSPRRALVRSLVHAGRTLRSGPRSPGCRSCSSHPRALPPDALLAQQVFALSAASQRAAFGVHLSLLPLPLSLRW